MTPPHRHMLPAVPPPQAVRACPQCRVTTRFVTPSSVWPADAEDKQRIVSEYKTKLSNIHCKHFARGEGKCPFGNRCAAPPRAPGCCHCGPTYARIITRVPAACGASTSTCVRSCLYMHMLPDGSLQPRDAPPPRRGGGRGARGGGSSSGWTPGRSLALLGVRLRPEYMGDYGDYYSGSEYDSLEDDLELLWDLWDEDDMQGYY